MYLKNTLSWENLQNLQEKFYNFCTFWYHTNAELCKTAR